MNVPLQMRAVSRGRFQKSRVVTSAGRVLPSWIFQCDEVACSCPDGSVACCATAAECSCGTTGNGPSACTHGHGNGHPHPGGATGNCPEHHESFSCNAGEFTCYNVTGNAEPCN